VQITTATLTKVVQTVLTLMSHHRALQATFVSDGKEILYLLNLIASKSLDGPQVNKYFAALLACLVDIPEIVHTRGEVQVECFKTLTVKCLTKLTKQHIRADAVCSPLSHLPPRPQWACL
jgi:hypothetical protein